MFFLRTKVVSTHFHLIWAAKARTTSSNRICFVIESPACYLTAGPMKYVVDPFQPEFKYVVCQNINLFQLSLCSLPSSIWSKGALFDSKAGFLLQQRLRNDHGNDYMGHLDWKVMQDLW